MQVSSCTVTDGYTREMTPVVFIKPGCYYSETFYFRAAHSNASCGIYIKSKSSSNPLWFGHYVEVKTPQCKSLTGELPSAFVESE